MKQIQNINSYYSASAIKSRKRASLKGKHICDVCIVGGGFSGLSAGLSLARAGYKVILLEAKTIGWGASGRNGGQLLNGYGCEPDKLAAYYGQDTADALSALATDGSGLIKSWVKEYKIKCDLKETGCFYGANNKKQLRLLEKDAGKENVITGSEIKNYVGTNAYIGGVFDPNDAHIHPLNLALGEAKALEKESGTIFEHSRATAITQGKKSIVHTKEGQVACDYVILAGNAYLGDLMPSISSRIMPVSSQIITTEPLSDEYAQRVLPSDSCASDCNFVLDYYRLTADKRLLFGGGAVYGGADPQNIIERLRPNMLRLFPYLEDTNIEFAWSGMIAITFTRAPHVGRISNNIYYSQGYSGHGVNVTHLIGKLISESIQQQSSTFDTFADIKHMPFPGGRWLRIPLTNLGVFYYQLRDKLGF